MPLQRTQQMMMPQKIEVFARSEVKRHKCRAPLCKASVAVYGCAPTNRSAFTLLELILVMATLAIVLGVAFPSLQGFFRARNLDSEARRFLSLTRYGQSRAVSEGVPMVLWIDAREGSYGLEPQAGYTYGESNTLSFAVDQTLQVEAQTLALTLLTQSNLWTQPAQAAAALPTIRFLPDGSISETSPEQIALRQGRDEALWIVQTTNRLKYEIRADKEINRR